MKIYLKICGALVLILALALIAIKSGSGENVLSSLSGFAEATTNEPSDTVLQSSGPACVSCGHDHDSGARETPCLITLDHIPESTLKMRLLALKPHEREEALNTLSRINFQTNDLDSVRVGPEGAIYYVCTFTNTARAELAEGIVEAAAGDVAELLPEVEGVSVPISSPPIRHSRPNAAKVLFLDFNGHVIEDTLWNMDPDYGSVGSWDCRAWSMDGDRSTFSATEQDRIVEIWERVAEDYAPFNVDVTTEEPAVWTSQTGHALITPTTDKNNIPCPHDGYGGLAYVDVFGKSTYSYNAFRARSPAWCKDYTGSSCAEVISHELGHNMGLSHDGTSSLNYYPGHVNGGIKWGPIMGTGYNDDVSQWSKGEYYDANRTSQDDLALIAEKLTYRPDDAGDNNASATVLTILEDDSVSQSGVIERTGNPDVYHLTMLDGQIAITAAPYRAASGTWGGNLDIELKLYNEAGELLESDNPSKLTSASIVRTVAAGNYYLHVIPVGVGTPMANPPSGYTSYGSLGQYFMSGSVSGDGDEDHIPNYWEEQYFSSAALYGASDDPDNDGSDNYSEFIAGTHPNSASSVFAITSSSVGTPYILNWSTVEGRVYSVGYTANLQYTEFSDFSDAINLPHTVNSYTDTVDHATSKGFYRVDVQLAP